MASNAAPQRGDTYLSFNGTNSYVEIPSHEAYSVDHSGELTVAAWILADVEEFPHHENGYVHWTGNRHRYGDTGDQEWLFRMYNQSFPERPKRTSFYVFNPMGGLGVGSYVQENFGIGEWRLIAASVDNTHTYMYRNGAFVNCDPTRPPDRGIPVRL